MLGLRCSLEPGCSCEDESAAFRGLAGIGGEFLRAQAVRSLAPRGDAATTTAKNVGRVDLLMMIDNSPSMADKQLLVAATIPDLLQALANPSCIDLASGASMQPAAPSDDCPGGYQREFAPLTDLHVGVITSSLGGHGADICSADSPNFNPQQQDMGI